MDEDPIGQFFREGDDSSLDPAWGDELEEFVKAALRGVLTEKVLDDISIDVSELETFVDKVIWGMVFDVLRAARWSLNFDVDEPDSDLTVEVDFKEALAYKTAPLRLLVQASAKGKSEVKWLANELRLIADGLEKGA